MVAMKDETTNEGRVPYPDSLRRLVLVAEGWSKLTAAKWCTVKDMGGFLGMLSSKVGGLHDALVQMAREHADTAGTSTASRADSEKETCGLLSFRRLSMK